MAKRKKFQDIWETEFERFFYNGEWDRLLNGVRIPKSALTFPPEGSTQDFSWDRRAAWLLFVSMRRKKTRHHPFPWDAPQ